MLQQHRTHPRLLADAMIVLVMACALALPALLWLLQDTLGGAVAQRSGGIVVLFLQDDKPTTVTRLEQQIRPSGVIADWEHLSQEQSRRSFARYLGIDERNTPLDQLEVPATVTLRMHADISPEDGDRHISEWRALDGVSDIWWDRAELERSQQLYSTLRRLGVALTLVLFGAGLAIIGGSVGGRMARERPAIVVMTLLGATDGFIMRPHLIHAVLLGIAAAAIGALLLSLGSSALGPSLAGLEAVLGVPITPPQPGGGMLLILFVSAPALAAATTVYVVRQQLHLLRQD